MLKRIVFFKQFYPAKRSIAEKRKRVPQPHRRKGKWQGFRYQAGPKTFFCAVFAPIKMYFRILCDLIRSKNRKTPHVLPPVQIIDLFFTPF